MTPSIRVALGCAFVIVTGTAATFNPPVHLTASRVLHLTAPADAPSAQSYRVEISSLGQALLPTSQPEGEITRLQQTFFPTEFAPPQAAPAGSQPTITSGTPTDFEKLPTGWTVHLRAKSIGKLVAISGLANFMEAGSVPASYGEVAAPIYADGSDVVITPNVMNMAKVQTTTTRFQLFALPGKTYEVTFYRGTQAEKHQVSVTLE